MINTDKRLQQTAAARELAAAQQRRGEHGRQTS